MFPWRSLGSQFSSVLGHRILECPPPSFYKWGNRPERGSDFSDDRGLASTLPTAPHCLSMEPVSSSCLFDCKISGRGSAHRRPRLCCGLQSALGPRALWRRRALHEQPQRTLVSLGCSSHQARGTELACLSVSGPPNSFWIIGPPSCGPTRLPPIDQCRRLAQRGWAPPSFWSLWAALLPRVPGGRKPTHWSGGTVCSPQPLHLRLVWIFQPGWPRACIA